MSIGSHVAIAPIPAPSALSDSQSTLATARSITEPQQAGITAALTVNHMPHNCDPPPPTPLIKVLIVEDEFVLAANLQEILEASGYMVTGMATSAIETLQQVEQERPDVVLMDIHLHGSRDGIETATFLWRTFQLPAVYLTSHSDRATLERAYESLPFGYLLKPVWKAELVRAINAAYVRCQTIQP